MKNATIFHGTGNSPDDFWFPWLAAQLTKREYDVSVPELPNRDHPDLRNWLPVAQQREYNSESVVIGHSAGAALILALLEHLDSPIKQAILVAGFGQLLPDFRDADAILQSTYDWKRIRANVDDIVFINSNNDPWGCDDAAGRYMFDNIGGTLIVPHNQGHMGSHSNNQPYKEFPLLLKLVL